MTSQVGSRDAAKHGGGPTRGSRASQARTAGSQPRNKTRGDHGTRGQTRGDQTTRGQTRGDQTTRGQTRGGQTTAGGSKKPTSLFDDTRNTNGATAPSGEADDGVKANDIWSKFVTDDANVVRAPTADSNISSGTGSQVTGSQGSEHLSQVEEEGGEEDEEEEESSDDDRTVYSDYYLPPAYVRQEGTPEPRAEIVDSHEACSCFPDRSNKLLGSMLYDKIQCVHTGLIGHTQPGVFKFNPFWNEGMEIPRRLRKRDMKLTKTKFVFGYPRPRFEIVSDSETDEDEEDGDEEEADSDAEREPSRARTGPMTGQRSRYSDDEDDEEDEESDGDYIPFELPQIGYPYSPSPPASSRSYRSEYSDYSYSNVPDTLPELPKTRQLTAQTTQSRRTQKTQQTRHSSKTAKTAKTGKTEQSKKSGKDKKSAGSDAGEDASRRTTASRQSLPDGPIVGASRTFQGRLYDPVSKQVLLYDIGTKPGERLPVGNIEPLYKSPTPPIKGKGKGPAPGDKPSSQASNRSKASQGSGPKAALVGAVFISNLLSKNKQNRNDFEIEDDG